MITLHQYSLVESVHILARRYETALHFRNFHFQSCGWTAGACPLAWFGTGIPWWNSIYLDCLWNLNFESIRRMEGFGNLRTTRGRKQKWSVRSLDSIWFFETKQTNTKQHPSQFHTMAGTLRFCLVGQRLVGRCLLTSHFFLCFFLKSIYFASTTSWHLLQVRP